MRALLFLLPGLGDALTSGPIIEGAARANWSLDVAAMLEPVRQYGAALDSVGEVEYFDLFKGPVAALPSVVRMRRHAYDAAFLPFPATRWQYHALACAIGAKVLYTHDYGGAARLLDRAVGARLVALQGGHRIAENARLARAAGLTVPAPSYVVPPVWKSARKPELLGVHPGTMRYKGNEQRRWPLANFAALVRSCVERGRRVRLFIGPEEREESTPLIAAIGSPLVEVVDANLDEAARSLSECEVFVGNDAGFGHLAAALGVKTVVLYGMTDPVRSLPVGRTLAVRPSDCPSCHDEGMRTFDCVRNIDFRCIRIDLTVADAARAVERAFSSEIGMATARESGDFRLYGRARTSRVTTSASDPTNQKSADASDIASGT